VQHCLFDGHVWAGDGLRANVHSAGPSLHDVGQSNSRSMVGNRLHGMTHLSHMGVLI